MVMIIERNNFQLFYNKFFLIHLDHLNKQIHQFDAMFDSLIPSSIVSQ